MPATSDPLREYRSKRKPSGTPEPFGIGREAPAARPRRFVVQKHAARRLHYDFRLELGGVLVSWAVPKGPSLDPAERRLAVHVEDHPLDYAGFEGVIPAGNYGAGPVIVWDQGTWTPVEDPEQGLRKGKLLFDLRGYKLRGRWTLVRTKGGKDWLLIKKEDEWSRPGAGFAEESVLSGLTIEDLRDGRDRADEVRTELERLGAPHRKVRVADVGLMLAESRDRPFSGGDWIFELKVDGYRLLLAREGKDVSLRLRGGGECRDAFPEIVRALSALPFDSVVLDGELAVLDDSGRPSFQRLQQRVQLARPLDVERGSVELPATVFVFDLLAFDGFDVRPLPLSERKRLLGKLVPRVGPLQLALAVEERGEDLFREVEGLDLEGIVAKRAASPYRAGRSPQWLKIRVRRSADFAVVGFTRPKGSRAGFGALHLGCFRGGRIVYAGRVGTGFSERQLREVAKRLEAAARTAPPPLGNAPAGKEHVWVEPEVVCEVRYRERTDDGLLRQPVFVRFREDKRPEECPAEPGRVAPRPERRGPGVSEQRRLRKQPSSARAPGIDGQPARVAPRPERRGLGGHRKRAGGAAAEHGRLPHPKRFASHVDGAGAGRAPRRATGSGGIGAAQGAKRPSSGRAPGVDGRIPFSNLDKVFWPDEGYTKGDLIEYHRAIAPWLLPYLRDRPLVLTRYPDGIRGKSFYQKDAPGFVPDWVRTRRIWSGHAEREIDYFVCDDLESLLYVVNLGTIPIHVWSSRASSLELPDWCVIDLDPKEAPFRHVIRIAKEVRALCEEIDLPCFIKTSGASGLHVLVPLAGQCTYQQSQTLGELVGRVIVGRLPEIATIVRPIRGREGKVYVDFLQNRHGQTIVAPFSVRPLPGAPVSMPLEWREVNARLDPKRFTMKTAPERMRRRKRDPLLAVLDARPDLFAVLSRLGERLR